ncbi:hypothetical protein Tco_0105932 [Tanacetum coccineum]
MTMSRDIDFEEDLKKKRGMITNEIFKMTSLNQQEKYEVMEKIRSDVGYVEAYWDMDDTNLDLLIFAADLRAVLCCF